MGGKILLKKHIGGIFVAGGGAITSEQCFLWRFRDGSRLGDYYVPAKSLDGSDSLLNQLLLPGYEGEAKLAAAASGLGVTLDCH